MYCLVLFLSASAFYEFSYEYSYESSYESSYEDWLLHGHLIVAQSLDCERSLDCRTRTNISYEHSYEYFNFEVKHKLIFFNHNSNCLLTTKTIEEY